MWFNIQTLLRIDCIEFSDKSCIFWQNSRYFPAMGKFPRVFLSIKGDGSSALPFPINLPLTWNWPKIGIGLHRLIPRRNANFAKATSRVCHLHRSISCSLFRIHFNDKPQTKIGDTAWHDMEFFHNHIVPQTLNMSARWLIIFVSTTSLFVYWPKQAVLYQIVFPFRNLFFALLLTLLDYHLQAGIWFWPEYFLFFALQSA